MHCARALNEIIVLIARRFPTKAEKNNVPGTEGNDWREIQLAKVCRKSLSIKKQGKCFLNFDIFML